MSFTFDSQEGLIVAQAVVSVPSRSISVNLALDTGAVMTVLARRFFQVLGYDLSVSSDRVQITTGSGVELVPEITLARIEDLGHERSDFPAPVPHTAVERDCGWCAGLGHSQRDTAGAGLSRRADNIGISR